MQDQNETSFRSLSDYSDITKKAWIAVARIESAIATHKPIAVFGLFSGGHDSLSSTYITSRVAGFTSAVHINTGIGIPATNQFVHATCAERSWKLIELKAAENRNAKGELDPQVYRDLCLRHGFPGPGGHGMMYVRLKERALALLARQYGATCRGKDKRRIMLIAGCRSKESTRRMGNVEPLQVRGRFVWVNPIHDWTKLDTTRLIEWTGLKRNPVVDLIHKSGECLCGAFAKPGELEELALWPETRPAYDHIIALQKEVAAAGKHAIWGTRPPKQCYGKGNLGPLCHGCKVQEAEAK